MSDGIDRATIHQLVITGLGQQDNACTPCPAGSCGNGGLASCPTCSPSTFSKTDGSKGASDALSLFFSSLPHSETSMYSKHTFMPNSNQDHFSFTLCITQSAARVLPLQIQLTTSDLPTGPALAILTPVGGSVQQVMGLVQHVSNTALPFT